MSGPEEKVKGFLKEIKSNQKKLKVQISVVLKKIEDYLLVNKPTLSENHIKLLFLGDYEEEQKGICIAYLLFIYQACYICVVLKEEV